MLPCTSPLASALWRTARRGSDPPAPPVVAYGTRAVQTSQHRRRSRWSLIFTSTLLPQRDSVFTDPESKKSSVQDHCSTDHTLLGYPKRKEARAAIGESICIGRNAVHLCCPDCRWMRQALARGEPPLLRGTDMTRLLKLLGHGQPKHASKVAPVTHLWLPPRP